MVELCISLYFFFIYHTIPFMGSHTDSCQFASSQCFTSHKSSSLKMVTDSDLCLANAILS